MFCYYLFFKIYSCKDWESSTEGIFMKEILKENMYILTFIFVIMKYYFKWKKLTAFYSQGLNSWGEGKPERKI